MEKQFPQISTYLAIESPIAWDIFDSLILSRESMCSFTNFQELYFYLGIDHWSQIDGKSIFDDFVFYNYPNLMDQ